MAYPGSVSNAFKRRATTPWGDSVVIFGKRPDTIKKRSRLPHPQPKPTFPFLGSGIESIGGETCIEGSQQDVKEKYR